jgi:hypothetical protein
MDAGSYSKEIIETVAENSLNDSPPKRKLLKPQKNLQMLSSWEVLR